MDLVKHLEKKNPSLYGDLQDIKKFSLARWQTPYLSWFTNHNVEHSEEIIHLLGQILKPIEDSLSEHELFVLLASAYLHDIGMTPAVNSGHEMTHVACPCGSIRSATGNEVVLPLNRC